MVAGTVIVDECGLTPSLNWSAYSLRKDWNRAKGEVAPWWGENSKEAYSSGLANLARALKNWGESRNGKRNGRRAGFPRFKGRRAGLSCRFTTGSFGLVEQDRRHVKLPRIGVVRTHESTRKLARHVERGTARIRSATVSHRAGRWFCSFSVEITRHDPAPTRPGTAVGVDLGVKALAVLSTGEVVPNPKHLEVAQRELRRLQRQAARRVGPDKRTKQRPSKRWRKSQTRISKLHARVADARRDGLHKLTTRLVRTCGAIVVEDLNVSGMLANRRLARHVAGVGMAELRRQIEYKATRAGVRVRVASRWYPSSKTCSACGAVKTKLRLSERTFTCQSCGFTLDRDLNAARNLAGLLEASSPSCGATLNEPAGNPHKTRTTRRGPAPTRQRVGSGHRSTRFLNGCGDDHASQYDRAMPKPNHGSDARRRIVEAARRMVAERGVHASTMRGIARDAGVSTGAVTHYFADKADMMTAVLRENNTVFVKRIGKAAAGSRGLAALEAAMGAILPLDGEMLKCWTVLIAFWGHAPAERFVEAEGSTLGYHGLRTYVMSVLQEAADDGELIEGVELEHEAERILALVGGMGLMVGGFPKQLNLIRSRALRMLSELVAALRATG
ncbi:MAG: IS200/IS605 family element transposase accessory protein TnpB [Actinophytocola sp.]|nr:IS200/IS605 family element transposase accessory protein TnpB [Actinophytocola sp.]